MIISSLSPQKRKGRFNLIVDGAFYSAIDEMAIVKYSLKEGQEIDEDRLKAIVLDSESRSAFEKTIDILSCPKSSYEVRSKLKKYGYNDEVIESAVTKAKQYGYLNDLEYAMLVVASKKNKSRMEIKNALIKKGIDRNTLEEALKSIDDEAEYQSAEVLAEKYLKNKEVTRELCAKLYAYLMRKGYKGEVAKKIVNNKKRGEDDFDWD